MPKRRNNKIISILIEAICEIDLYYFTIIERLQINILKFEC